MLRAITKLNSRPIEAGLLRVFRYFATVAAAYCAVNLLYYSLMAGGGVLVARPLSMQFGLLGYMLLLAFLYWPGLDLRLREIFLPIALSIATVVPVLIVITIRLVGPIMPASPEEMGLWPVFPLLFIPLILIAWQYNFRSVLILTIAVVLVDLGLILAAVGQISLDTIPAISSVFIRAIALAVVGQIVSELMITQREQRHDLVSANLRLSQHAATLEDLAVSQERNRLARELHDTLAHTLSGMAVNLEALKLMIPQELSEVHQMLDRSLESTRKGLAETRRALKDLRSQPLEDMGLKNALRDLAVDTASRGGLKLSLDLPTSPLDLTPDLEQCMYRIAQEALTNILHHADARNITIKLSDDQKNLTLEIIDDGKGFAAGEVDASEKFGLRGMQERARLAGGDLLVISNPGQGTRVEFSYRGER
ncbi:MAG TPA: sensor histidine kinase [Anaerolineaceae bacterium]|nr:sensor histidine kinase [Anaerolineaceae bacterium]HPN52006.1 sensor histidine kinase [Anaerolineaceae bacterium]